MADHLLSMKCERVTGADGWDKIGLCLEAEIIRIALLSVGSQGSCSLSLLVQLNADVTLFLPWTRGSAL